MMVNENKYIYIQTRKENDDDDDHCVRASSRKQAKKQRTENAERRRCSEETKKISKIEFTQKKKEKQNDRIGSLRDVL